MASFRQLIKGHLAHGIPGTVFDFLLAVRNADSDMGITGLNRDGAF